MFFILFSKQPSQVGSLFTFLARQMAKQEKRIHVNKVLFEQVGGLESSMSRVWCWEKRTVSSPGFYPSLERTWEREVKKGTHFQKNSLYLSSLALFGRSIPRPTSSPLPSSFPLPLSPRFQFLNRGGVGPYEQMFIAVFQVC